MDSRTKRDFILFLTLLVLIYIVTIIVKDTENKDTDNANNNKNDKDVKDDANINPKNLSENLPKVLDNKRELRQITHDDPYIKPVEFSIGFVNSNGKTANLGSDTNVLYPINSLDVNYGSKAPTEFPGERFIRSI